MGRTSRNNMKNSSFFHIMIQGINKEYIFETQKNKEKYLKLMNRNKQNMEIIAYCIMDNHGHILVQAKEIQNMQNCMKKTNTSYAIYYNKEHNRVGYVFRERYKAQPIKSEKHLFLALEYIHNNPVKAGICKKDEYEFSSYTKIYQKDQSKIQKRVGALLEQSTKMLQNQEEGKEEEFNFLEDEKENKEQKCQTIICDFLQKKNLDLERLKRDEKKLIEMIKILKDENNISYRLMAKYLKMNRERLRRLVINET